MSSEWQPLGRGLIFFGVILSGMGMLLLVLPKVPWIGRLPGDLFIQRERVTFYFPLASCLVASLIVSLLVWLTGRFRP